ncbi:MAG: tetratricopeptide repeat protein [Flavobacteriales bacterium]|nr:tetratricopeptide repeat protein [Flavobacteriales bacterium]
MKRPGVTIFFLLVVHLVLAQTPIDFNLLVNRTHADRTFLLNDYYEGQIRAYDSLQVAEHIEVVRSLAQKYDDVELGYEAEVMRGHYLVNAIPISDEYVVDECKKLIELGEKDKVIWLQVRMHSVLGHFYLNRMQQYAYGLFHLTKAAELMRNLDLADYPLKYLCNYHVGLWQYQLDDMQEALKSFRLALDPKPEAMFVRSNIFTLNAIGLIFRRSNQLDSSDAYITKALRLSEASNDTAWEAITSGNLGENYYLRGEFEKAVPLLQADLAMAEKTLDCGLASNALALLGEIALHQGDIRTAEVQLTKALLYARQWNEVKRFAKVYPGLAKLAAKKGNAALVAAYIDSATMVKDTMDKLKSSLLTTKAQQSVEREHLEDAMRISQLEKEKNVAERNMALALVLALSVIFVVIFSRLWNRFKNKQSELTKAKKALEEFAYMLAEKNIRLAEFDLKAEIESDEELLELQQTTILTDEDWANFQVLFNKVYPGYLDRLTERHTHLSFTEVRYMALLKMNVSPKQMSSMLGVGDNAIRQYRLRIRTRLGITAADDLQALVENI